MDVNLVAADTIVTSFIGSYVSENGATSHDLYVCPMGTQFRSATVVLARLLSSACPYNAFYACPSDSFPAQELLTLPPPPDFGSPSSDGLVFISEIIQRLVNYSSDICARSSDVLFIIDTFLVLPPPPCLQLSRITSWCGTTSVLIHCLYE